MKDSKFSLYARIKSFGFALNGLKFLLKHEHNARIHLIALMLVCLMGWSVKLNPSEWISIVVVSGFVIATEILNTCVERLADFISPEKHPKIKIIKDLAAAAVLVSAVVSIIVGMIIFLPKLLAL